jgi:hypothetical protein
VDGSFAARTLCNAESYDASETTCAILRTQLGHPQNKSYGVVGHPCKPMDLHYEIGGTTNYPIYARRGWSAGDKAGYNGVCKTMYYHGYACAISITGFIR